MENKVNDIFHSIYYRLVFSSIGTLVLLALLIIMVWSTITDFTWGGFSLSLIILTAAGLVFLFFINAFQDIRQGITTDAGTVNRKGIYFIGVTCEMGVTRDSFEDNQELEVPQEMSEFYAPTDRQFKVSKKIYDWILPGDKVIVTYWPHTCILVRIDKPRPRLK